MKSKMAARAAARDTKVTSANSSYVEQAVRSIWSKSGPPSFSESLPIDRK
jgi:hypothetical protein